MDKRTAANLAVKKKITDAVFKLMGDKDIADISVTEIIGEAGVARASFYRNYSSKEDVLLVHIHDILQKFLDGRSPEEVDCRSYEHIVRCFRFFKEYDVYALGMYRSNYATVLLEELNVFHMAIAGNMPTSSIERYSIYTYIGALFNTAIAWLNGGATESAEEMAHFFLQTLK